MLKGAEVLSKSRKESGFKAAQLGGAIGFRFCGPYGMLIGTICGFSVGILIDEVLED
jgi:chromate transport protein ChrA